MVFWSRKKGNVLYAFLFFFLTHTSNKQIYFHNLRNDVFASLSLFVTFTTAISKSSCVTCIRFSRMANIPASVHTAYIVLHFLSHFALRPAGIGEHPRNLPQIDSSHQIHSATVDLQNLQPSLRLTLLLPRLPPRWDWAVRFCGRFVRVEAARGPKCRFDSSP